MLEASQPNFLSECVWSCECWRILCSQMRPSSTLNHQHHQQLLEEKVTSVVDKSYKLHFLQDVKSRKNNHQQEP